MEKKELLNEENYQNTKNKISKIAFIIIGIGVLIGLSLIGTGIYKNAKINERYSEKNIAKVGDTVRIVETRPLSKTKHFYLKEIVKEAVII